MVIGILRKLIWISCQRGHMTCLQLISF